jgi:phytoene dehydrogenase-like protein
MAFLALLGRVAGRETWTRLSPSTFLNPVPLEFFPPLAELYFGLSPVGPKASSTRVGQLLAVNPRKVGDAKVRNVEQWFRGRLKGSSCEDDVLRITQEVVTVRRADGAELAVRGIFKIDYALDGPLPWIHEVCKQVGTIHIGGTFDEIAESEIEVTHGECPARPFLLLSQPTLFDPSRAPGGRARCVGLCHVPEGSSFDMTERIEKQIARFAPGFHDRVLVRRTTSATELERTNANLIGGSITGGANYLWQMLARPTLSATPYRTPIKSIFLCSSSTPPGAGVHGMCGFHAANAALTYLHGDRRNIR